MSMSISDPWVIDTENREGIEKKVSTFFKMVVNNNSLISKQPLVIHGSIQEKEKVSRYILDILTGQITEFSNSGYDEKEMLFVMSSVILSSADLKENISDKLDFYFFCIVDWYESKEEFSKAQEIYKKFAKDSFMKGKSFMNEKDFERANDYFKNARENYERALDLYEVRKYDKPIDESQRKDLRRNMEKAGLFEEECFLKSSESHLNELKILQLHIDFFLKWKVGLQRLKIICTISAYVYVLAIAAWGLYMKNGGESYLFFFERVVQSPVGLSVHSLFAAILLFLLGSTRKSK